MDNIRDKNEVCPPETWFHILYLHLQCVNVFHCQTLIWKHAIFYILHKNNKIISNLQSKRQSIHFIAHSQGIKYHHIRYSLVSILEQTLCVKRATQISFWAEPLKLWHVCLFPDIPIQAGEEVPVACVRGRPRTPLCMGQTPSCRVTRLKLESTWSSEAGAVQSIWSYKKISTNSQEKQIQMHTCLVIITIIIQKRLAKFFEANTKLVHTSNAI